MTSFVKCDMKSLRIIRCSTIIEIILKL